MSPDAPLLAVDALVKRFGAFHALDDLSFALAGGRDSRAGRPERLGQDHLHQRHLRASTARRRPGAVRRTIRSAGLRRTGSRTGHQPHVPGAEAVPVADRARERRDWRSTYGRRDGRARRPRRAARIARPRRRSRSRPAGELNNAQQKTARPRARARDRAAPAAGRRTRRRPQSRRTRAHRRRGCRRSRRAASACSSSST